MMLKKGIHVPSKKEKPVAKLLSSGTVRRLDQYYNAGNDDVDYYAAADDAAAGDDAAGDDAAAAADDDVEQYYQQRDDDMYLNYGFDLSTYSLKYATCSSIATYSDDLAQDEDSSTVLRTDQYVVFRLCPSDTCNSASVYGCQSDYGEYMLPIEDWLEIIAEYREEEFERYCEYCAECDIDEYYQAADDAGNDQDEEQDGEERRNRRLADEDQAQVDDAYINEEDPYSDGYCSACSDYADVSNDQVLYIGPYCSSDKSAIVLTMFDDEYCSNYVGDQYDINTLTGLDLTSETLMQYYNNDCIACKESELAFQDANDDADENEDNNDITEVCENIYNAAAKCNQYMSSATQKSYQSSEQYDNESNVCNFIKSVVTGAYDEHGYIYFDASAYSSDNEYNEFASDLHKVEIVTAGQIFGLVIFSSVVLFFFMSACIMHGKIQKKNMSGIGVGTINQNIGGANISGMPSHIPRQNSGIMACRSEATTGSNISGDDDDKNPYMGGTMT